VAVAEVPAQVEVPIGSETAVCHRAEVPAVVERVGLAAAVEVRAAAVREPAVLAAHPARVVEAAVAEAAADDGDRTPW
jgi:hypothetical protein